MKEDSLLAAAVLLSLFVASSATAGCTTKIDSSSLMFGAGLTKPSNNSWVVYEQETQWRQKGDISKINLYYDDVDKCLRGVKPTYGFKAADALRLGSEGTATRDYYTNDLKLQANEVFIKAEYRYSTRCIEFLRLTTSKGRQLIIGNSVSTSPLLTSKPVAAKGAFLGFVKGFVDQKIVGARTGLLQQLQFYWVQRTCSAPAPGPAPSGGPIIVVPSPSPAPVPAKCSPPSLMGCKNGRCPSSSCPLSGLGGDVPMLCYGSNAQVFGDLDLIINPCTNLACKFDVANCTSKSVLGLIGSVCTGKIVAPNPTAKLHPIGSLLLNYPCIEYSKMLTNFLPISGNANNGIYMPKAWKACDCLAGIAAVVQTLENLPTGFNFTVLDFTSPQMAAALAQLFIPTLPVVDWATTLGQWLAANTLSLPVPKISINPTALASLQSVLGGNFTLPCLVVPEMAAALLSVPESLQNIPVFKIPTVLLKDVAKIVNLTTLATVVLPTGSMDPLPTLLSTLGITMPDLTITGLKDLATSFVSSGTAETALKSLLTGTNMAGFTLPLVNLTMVDLLAQLTAAAKTGQLPVMALVTAKLNALKALIPGLTTPAVLITNTTANLLESIPQALGIPAFVIPNSMLNAVNLLLPNLTAVPTIIHDVASQVPSISLSAFNIDNLISTVQGLALNSPVPILGLPSLPTLGSLLSVNVTGIANLVTNLQQSLATLVSQGPASAWTQLTSSLGDAMAAVIPDGLQNILMNSGTNNTSALASGLASIGSSLATGAAQFNISTGFMAPTVWAALSSDVQAALLAIINSGKK